MAQEIKAAALPALCVELKIRDDDGVPLVNSSDVAERFGKQHKHVLRDINSLEISPDLGRSWFRPAVIRDSYGREQPSFDLTPQPTPSLAVPAPRCRLSSGQSLSINNSIS